MSLEHVFNSGLIILITLPVISIICCKMSHSSYTQYCSTNLSRIAKRNTCYVGQYSSRTTVSIKYWIFSMLVNGYKLGKADDVYNLALAWNSKYNHDISGYISVGIDKAFSEFRDVLQKALDNNVEPKFNVSPCYDYHDFPLSFMYNDYVDPEALLKDIDSLLEVC